VTLVPGVDVHAQVRHRYGGRAAILLDVAAGGERTVRWEQVGPLGWVHAAGVLSFQSAELFFVAGAWRELRDDDAFAQLIADARPDLADAALLDALPRAYGRIVADAEPLMTQADVDDLRDPRWHVMPLSAEAAAQWEPPHAAGGALTFVVHRRGALVAVRVTESYAVETSART
jgi:hypothetical protein